MDIYRDLYDKRRSGVWIPGFSETPVPHSGMITEFLYNKWSESQVGITHTGIKAQRIHTPKGETIWKMLFGEEA